MTVRCDDGIYQWKQIRIYMWIGVFVHNHVTLLAWLFGLALFAVHSHSEKENGSKYEWKSHSRRGAIH